MSPTITLKFLIDTGADSSYIDPKYIKPSKIQKIKPLTVNTLFKKHIITKKVIVPGFPEFQTKDPLTFYLFKFHSYFDGLIGLNIIKQLGIKLDFNKSTLETNKVLIPFIYRPNCTSPIYKIPPRNKMVVSLPIDQQQGEVYIKPIEINPQTIIPEGIYNANNWHASVEVINFSNKIQTIIFEQPVKTESLSNYKLEINHSITSSGDSNEPQDIRKLIRTSHLNLEEKQILEKLCQDFEQIFQKENQNLSFTNTIKHSIDLKVEKPIFTKSYRYPHIHKNEVETQISKMLQDGIIRHSFSPWSSPIWIVPKKSDASGKIKWRLVVDYRKLNEQTVDDKYPLPNITEILDKLGRCNYFTTLDLASGFHQIEVETKDIPKTAFTVEFGHYEYVRMPFGLKNAPSTFQRVMDNVLQGLQGRTCLCYMDDIVIFSSSLQEHIKNLKQVFMRLKQANLKIQLDKSEFMHKELIFLGHIITREGVKPNPTKIEAVKNFPIPKTAKQIKSFLGLLGYYRKFIRNFAEITKPMTTCLRKDKKIILNEEYISCFTKCKQLLCEEPILQYPDFTQPFKLTTDASNFALGAILSQGKKDLPICYASRTLNSAEQNYSATEKELLAIVWGVKQFRPYLYGKKFKIVTDHRPLQWLMNLKEPNSKLVRWRLKLEEYDYEIEYKKGTLNSNADALSRIEKPMEINTSSLTSNQSDFLGFEDETQNEEHTLQIQTCNFKPKSSNIQATESIRGYENPANPNALEPDIIIHTTISPLNEFKNQLLIKPCTSYKEKQEILFKNKHRTTIFVDYNHPYLNSILTHIMEAHVSSTGITTIACENTFFEKFHSHLNFLKKKCKILRTHTLLIDVEIPSHQQKWIMKIHEEGQHRGAEENYLQLKRKVYFPNMKTIIQQAVNNCHTCITNKYDRLNKETQLELTETPHKPLETLHIDIFSMNGQKFLTILDKFTKFGQALPISNKISSTILKELKTYISIHGFPQKIITDNGTEFTSKIFKEYCHQNHIELHFTTPMNSTGNSPVERLHSTLIEIYRILRSDPKNEEIRNNPIDLMTEAIITYNNTIHSTTKMTPLELKNGHYTKLTIFPENNTNKTLDEYVKEHNNQYKILCKDINLQTHKNKLKVIKRLNKNRIKPLSIHPYDTVYEKLKQRNKDLPRYEKHIVSKNNKVTITTNKNRRIHKNKIKTILTGPPSQSLPK